MMFRKKHIVMLLLIALIAVSVYLNTSYAKSGGDYLLTDTSDSAETVKNLGEAALVSGGNGTVDTIDAASYFAQAKIVREQTRDEAVDLLQSVADNAAADADTRQKALNDISVIASAINSEGSIENMVKAKGYVECLAYISDSGVNVVVQSEGLEAVDAAVIKDIVISETQLPAEKIKIVEVK